MITKRRVVRQRLGVALLAGFGLLSGIQNSRAAEQVFPQECGAYQYLSLSLLFEFLRSTNFRTLKASEIKTATEQRRGLGHTWCLAGETLVRLGHEIVSKNAPTDPLQAREEFRINVIQALDTELGSPPDDLIYRSEEMRVALQGALISSFKFDRPSSRRGNAAETSGQSVSTTPVAGRTDDDPEPPKQKSPQPAAPAASGNPNCWSPEALRASGDPDVKRNAEQLISAGICYFVAPVKEHGQTWTFQTFLNPANPDGPAWYLPHDNENTAFRAALYALERYGGKVLTVHSGEKRNLGKTDPNRNFGTSKKEVKACASISGRPTPQYSGYVLDFFKGQRAVLAMHNNTNGGTVTAARTDSKNRGMLASGPPISKDPDDFIYVTGSKPFSQDKGIQQDVVMLREDGFNVVHEFVTLKNTDCSLSNFAAYRNLRYYNIEAQHGHLEQQTKMVDGLMRHLGYR